MVLEPRVGVLDERDTSRFLRALSNERRRDVLKVLLEEQTLGLTDLSHRLVDESEELDRYDTEQVYISLYHRHIPTLEGMGLVTFDQEQDTVALREETSEKLRMGRTE